MSALDLTPHVERLKKKIGFEAGPLKTEVEKGALIKFARAIGETNPLYFDEEYARTTRFGGIIAAPTYVSCFVTDLVSSMFDFDTPLKRSLHSDDIVENSQPIRAGDVISAMVRYADVYVREGKNGPLLFQAADMTLTNQRGERVAVVRIVAVSFT